MGKSKSKSADHAKLPVTNNSAPESKEVITINGMESNTAEVASQPVASSTSSDAAEVAA